MSSRIADMTGGLKSYLLLEYRIPVYTERANYYNQRAVLESMKNGVNVDVEKGVNFIDVTNAIAIALPNGNQVEFARNRDGIFFARIENGKYFPIDIKPSEELLKKARYFERASRSYFWRLLREPDEFTHFGSVDYNLHTIGYGLSDVIFLLNFFVEKLEKSTESLEQTVRKMDNETKLIG